MLERFKAFWQGVVLAPVVNLLLKLGVHPDLVTLVGTLGVAVGALAFYPRGELLVGTLVIAAFVFSDMIDGAMARKSGTSSTFGSFWDSTLDRIGDAAIFGGLALYFAASGDSYLYLCLSLFCLVAGNLTSYARAKAESLGLDAKGGIAERSDRLVLILTGETRTRHGVLALACGAVAGPLIHLASPQWSVMLGGLIGGTAAWGLNRMTQRD